MRAELAKAPRMCYNMDMKKVDKELALSELEKLYPDAKPALHFRTPYELLVAVVLSAQCTDERVNKVTAVLFEKYSTPEAMVTLTHHIAVIRGKYDKCIVEQSALTHLIHAPTDKVIQESTVCPVAQGGAASFHGGEGLPDRFQLLMTAAKRIAYLRGRSDMGIGLIFPRRGIQIGNIVDIILILIFRRNIEAERQYTDGVRRPVPHRRYHRSVDGYAGCPG